MKTEWLRSSSCLEIQLPMQPYPPVRRIRMKQIGFVGWVETELKARSRPTMNNGGPRPRFQLGLDPPYKITTQVEARLAFRQSPRVPLWLAKQSCRLR